jgi:hypothetical protein
MVLATQAVDDLASATLLRSSSRAVQRRYFWRIPRSIANVTPSSSTQCR